MKYDYLIIGGGIAGVTAAETIRAQDPGATIGIICNEPHVLYSRVLLPHYLKKRISREQLFLRKIDDFTSARIDLRLDEEVSFVDTRRREVMLSGGVGMSYQKLLLASGGRVKQWGRDEDKEFIYRLQTLDDADRMHEALTGTKTPLVIGGSFISLEFLEIFLLNGILPTLLFRDAHFLGRILDKEGAGILRNNFERHGIRVQAEDLVEEVTKRAGKLKVLTRALREIECDLIAVGTGLERNIGFLQDSGMEIGKNGVRTDEFLQTNQEGVYAAGDLAEFYDVVSGRHRIVGNWTNAFLQGKRAGLNMTGDIKPFRNVSGYSITNLGFHITALGDCEGELESVVRIDSMQNQYERFFLRNGVLAGAVLINRFQDKPHLAGLIEKQVRIDQYKDKLKDFGFDIRSIPAVG